LKLKQSKSNVISIIAKCALCGKQVTKKNFRCNVYLCDECNELDDTDLDIAMYNHIVELTERNEKIEDPFDILDVILEDLNKGDRK
jgi:hypothetical protein